MADGSDGTDVSPESEATATATAAVKGGEIWGTLEELLLACAVTRHGTGSWDSVAMEVQTRSPVAARPGLTPHSCRLRFRHLHRRFSTVGSAGEEAEAEADAEEDPDASAAEGWVDELRRLRVAELRRDVERCDLSIGTLQLKVKRLREERERSVSGGEAKPDEVSVNDRLSSEEEPGRSCRESNSTDLKPPKLPGHQGGGGGAGAKEQEVAKQEASIESAAASKESSDVRSSASLCRRRRRGGSEKADEEEDEEAASAARPPPAARSPSLAALVDAVSARLGSVLQRLREGEHDSEESAAYRGAIRRHVDLESVRRRLDASRADDADPFPARELYRDLLLLCTNAVVFFSRGTPEHAAAVEARALVTGHASAALLRDPKQEHAAAPAPAGADIVGSLIEKGKKPLIVCRKRSSIAKAARKEESATKGETEAVTTAAAAEEPEEEESEDEKKSATKGKKTWGMRTKKGRGGKTSAGPGRNLAAKAEDDADGPTKGAGALAKKRNAVDFLKRLNQSPQRKKRGAGSQLGTTRKRSAAMEQQTTTTTTTRKRGTGRKEGTGRGGSRRGGKAAGAKRGVGRPPQKRGPAPATPPPSKRAKTNSRAEKSSGTGKRGGRRSVG